MWRILKFIITGYWHMHEFEAINSGPLDGVDQSRGTRYEMQCKSCGHTKKVDLI